MSVLTIYDVATGFIKRTVSCPDSEADVQIDTGEDSVNYAVTGATHIIGGTPVTPSPGTPSLSEAKASKIAEIEAARYAEEVGGITVGSYTIDTDRTSRAQLVSDLLAFRGGLVLSTDWKASAGWVPLTALFIEVVYAAVEAHVRECFAKEKELTDDVNAASTVSAVQAITW